jgi:hypothetical protein
VSFVNQRLQASQGLIGKGGVDTTDYGRDIEERIQYMTDLLHGGFEIDVV